MSRILRGVLVVSLTICLAALFIWQVKPTAITYGCMTEASVANGQSDISASKLALHSGGGGSRVGTAGASSPEQVAARRCLDDLKKIRKPMAFATSKTEHPFTIAVFDYTLDTMISKTVVDHGLWDVHVLKALEHSAKDACMRGAMALDVGTNLGFFTMSLLSMGCRVTGFEMQQRMADLVNLSVCANDFEQNFTMNVGAVSDANTYLHMVNPTGGNLGGIGIIEGGGIQVLASRIDSLVDAQEIMVMKMDIEGHENKALLGMSGLFEKRAVKNIVMEFTPHGMGVEHAGDMIARLHAYGFHDIWELDYMDPQEYKNEAKMHRLDMAGPNWALDFAKKILAGGDARGLGFTDLLLQLSE